MTVRIDARKLITGTGAPIENASVVLSGSAITYVGPTENAPQAETIVTTDTEMPGLWIADVTILEDTAKITHVFKARVAY